MRILAASNFFPPHTVGGAEIVADRHLRVLAGRGHEVLALGGSVPVAGRPPGSLEPETHLGLEVQRLTLRTLDPDGSFRWPALARRLAALIEGRGIDVVHLHNLVGPGADSILAVKAMGRRCIVTLHDHWGFCLRQSLLRPNGAICDDFEECAVCLRDIVYEGDRLPIRLRRDFTAWCLEQADALVFPSAYLAGAYRAAGIAGRQMLVLSNGIDVAGIPEAAPRDPAVVRFLCSAALEKHKGIRVLLDAVRSLLADPALRGRWQVTLSGRGSLAAEAEAVAEQARADAEAEGHAPAFILTGHRPRAEVLAAAATSDVVMLPSIWPENEPVSLLEGAAAGAALLVTDCGGPAGMVEHERTGLVVPPGDVDAWTGAMRRLIVERALTERMGRANAERRATLDEARAVDRLEALYTEPLPTPPAPSPVIMIGPGSAPEPIIELVSTLYKHAELPPGTRLLRADWVPPHAWDHARLLWIWSDARADAKILAALRRGVPVLAPAHIGLERWTDAGAPVILYETPLQALAALQVLFGRPSLAESVTRLAIRPEETPWIAPRHAFELLAERLS